MGRVVGYARVSTANQNLDLQIDAIKKYAEKKSGLRKRPELEAAQKAMTKSRL